MRFDLFKIRRILLGHVWIFLTKVSYRKDNIDEFLCLINFNSCLTVVLGNIGFAKIDVLFLADGKVNHECKAY
ncbi:hypothetical protein D3C81_1307630 [compost metagenome]